MEKNTAREAVVAFAFGVPNTLPSNRLIAEVASKKADALNIPVYTQWDVMPLAQGVQVVLTEENYPVRVPTLRIARGAIAWLAQNRISQVWLCAAAPHFARTTRDLHYAAKLAGWPITVEICAGLTDPPYDSWFCAGSTQPDTRLKWLWMARDAILMHMPMWLYARIAG
jgi:hypothetical protein